MMIQMFGTCFILPIIKYRPEWYAIYMLIIMLSMEFKTMWHSLGSTASIIMTFVVCISAFYYDVVRRTFWDTKTCERMTRFRNAWKDSYDRNPEAVSQLAQRCREICGVLSQHRDT
jgi:amino acid transporter